MAWRPNGSTSYRPSERLRADRYRSGEARLMQQDLQLTASGKAMAILPKPSPAKSPGVRRRALARVDLSRYADATMADSARSAGQPYWHSENTFNMYATTTGTAHGAPVVPDVLKHPQHRRAPLSARLNYTAGALPQPRGSPLRAASGETTYRRAMQPPEPSRELASVVQAGDAAVEAAAQALSAAARPLVTSDPTQLEFGALRVESETSAAFPAPPPAPADAITFYSTAAQSPRSPRDIVAAGSVRHAPQTFRPVYATGMQSTYAATHTAQRAPTDGLAVPANAIAAVAAATARDLADSRCFDVPRMYETSAAAVGAFASDGTARPTTAPARSARDRQQFTGNMWQSKTRARPRDGSQTAREGAGAGAGATTEYHFAYDWGAERVAKHARASAAEAAREANEPFFL